jgi:hypothetical protein
MAATPNRAARRSEKREDEPHYQRNDPKDPQDVDRQHKSQDEQDNS